MPLQHAMAIDGAAALADRLQWDGDHYAPRRVSSAAKKGGTLRDRVLLSVGNCRPRAWSCDGEAVTSAMDAEVELI